MHRYFPHTPEDEAQMLAAIGAKSVEALFASVPPESRHTAELALNSPISEWELLRRATELADKQPGSCAAWVGAGSYCHHIPAMVSELASRSEFYTSYTPYQAEMSQGTLQGIFEFQTLVAELLGMDVANASMYDGATAMAEAMLMACRLTKRMSVAVSSAVHPHYRQVLHTYATAAGVELTELPYAADGTTKLEGDAGKLAAVMLHSPNVFGVIEPLAKAADWAHAGKSLLVAGFTEAVSYGLLASPGSQGADIVCGEAQSLGLAQGFGGPGLGLLATRKEYVRNIPGRLVGQTVDTEGRRAFVLTLSTREQHIRREKAVSNICSNSGLCAMTASIYMAALGGTGFRELAECNHSVAEYLKAGLLKAGFTPAFSGHTFNEFVLRAPAGFEAKWKALQDKGVLFGLDLGPWYNLPGHYLFCATEVRTKAEIDHMLQEVSA